MKKLVSSFLAVIMLCACFAISASMASADEGMVFNDPKIMYAVEGDLEKEPMTVEAVIFFNKRVPSGHDGGVFFGNYHWDNSSNNIDFGIDAKGIPEMRIRDDQMVHEYTFSNVIAYRSDWVNVTFVRDVAKKEARCYINGELAQTVPMTDEVKPLALHDFKIGSNNAYMNPDYFKGGLKSLKVYSDVRTDAEIKKDMETLDKSDLLVAYDFTGTKDFPSAVKDLSGNNNDAIRNRMFYDAEPVDPDTYAYTFAVIGDTQSMAKNFPDHFNDIYNYIYKNKDAMNIKAVLGLGDITDTFSGENTANEWKIALAGHKIIDDALLNIPLIGDHDNVAWYNKTISELNYADFAVRYSEDDLRNCYVTADIEGTSYLFIQFQKGPGDDILRWADKVVEEHPSHKVIIATHGYLYHDRTTLDKGDNHTGKMDNLADAMWDKFISKHENILLVLSGHIGHDYVVVNQRKGAKGNTVTEMLMDFQSVDNAALNYNLSQNGCGVVNLFHFSKDGKTLTVETVATVLGQNFMELNQLVINLDAPYGYKYNLEKSYAADVTVPEVTEPEVTEPVVAPTEIKMTLNSMTAYVNGEAKTLDAAPVIKNSRTMLPVRFVAENLGATVGWDDATKTVSINRSDVTIEIVIGATTAKVNGMEITLDSPAYIEPSNSRTYLPVRVVAENLGATVSWDDATKTATLVK